MTGPVITIVGGANGSGKSTSASALVGRDVPYINADEIAKGLTGEGKDIQASRMLLEEWDRLSGLRADFAIETTLASRTLAPRVRRLQESGYLFRLYFFWLPTVDLNIARVAERVRNGGHHIPEEVIRRRYRSGLENFFDIYQPIADEWVFCDNSVSGNPVVLAKGNLARSEVLAADVWDNIVRSIRMEQEPTKVREASAVYMTLETRRLERAIQRLARAAVLEHKRAGNPVCELQDGKVVWIQPEDIDLPEIPDDDDDLEPADPMPS